MSIKEVLIGSTKIGIKFQEATNPDIDPELWPTLGEYLMYDNYIYDIMSQDIPRNSLYLDALRKENITNKTAVDIGTGRDLNWARACIDAGAQKVYAIEGMKESYEKAKSLINELNLEKKIELIYGNSTQIELPEKVDFCISEIISNIGSAEGVCVVLRDAQERFLKNDGFMIPQRCVTKIAAVSIPENILADPHFTPDSVHYVEKIFNKVGHPFDLRLCFFQFPKSNILSSEDIFEDLDFTNTIKAEYSRTVNLSMKNDGKFDGLLLWINLYGILESDMLNSLEVNSNWLPVYFPLFYPGMNVQVGDELEIDCRTFTSDDGINPDYQVEGYLKTKGEEIPINHISSHHGNHFQKSAFHRALFNYSDTST